MNNFTNLGAINFVLSILISRINYYYTPYQNRARTYSVNLSVSFLFFSQKMVIFVGHNHALFQNVCDHI